MKLVIDIPDEDIKYLGKHNNEGFIYVNPDKLKTTVLDGKLVKETIMNIRGKKYKVYMECD